MKSDILEKIETLFWEHAFAEVSMDEIARKLEMKKASLYYHFPSKEQMFQEVLEFSFGKYREFLRAIFSELPPAPLHEGDKENTSLVEGGAEVRSGGSLDEMLTRLILFPLESQNLFAIVSQKWYCKIDVVRDMIMLRNQELFGLFFAYFHEKYAFNEARAMLLQNLLHDLGKKYCIFDCKNTLDSEVLILEIKKIFF